jgi:hypothetical protein
MSENDIKEVLAALQNLPDFKGINVAALDIQRLGGLTNLVFRVAAFPVKAPRIISTALLKFTTQGSRPTLEYLPTSCGLTVARVS